MNKLVPDVLFFTPNPPLTSVTTNAPSMSKRGFPRPRDSQSLPLEAASPKE
jgi:hypothetical protein